MRLGKLRNLAFHAIFVLACSGCATHSEWPSLEASNASKHSQLTKEIRIIADTQFHESRGVPSRYFSLAGDEFVGVTIRTGQQVIGAPDILFASLFNSYPLTLHVGDAIDLSCQTEWDLFYRVMRIQFKAPTGPGPQSWLFTNGNHDGFLAGNIFPIKNGYYKEDFWDNMCNAGQLKVKREAEVQNKYRFMKKSTINAKYLSAVIDSELGKLKQTGVGKFCDSSLYCIAHVSNNEWSDYIVQLVRVPAYQNAGDIPIYALLLDTSDYVTRPYIGFNHAKAGIDAGVTTGQVQAAIDLLRSIPENARFFLVGHHPYEKWGLFGEADDAAPISRLVEDKRFLNFVLTAHTHKGGWFKHKVLGKNIYELNTGSLADAPLYYRTLYFSHDENSRFIVGSNIIPLNANLYAECASVPLARDGYKVDDQRSSSDRHRDMGAVIRWTTGFASAAKHFFYLLNAKHAEIKPQLLAYADVIEFSMPVNYQFETSSRKKKFKDRNELAEYMRDLALCNIDENCPVKEKGILLKDLEEYYWKEGTWDEIRKKGHIARYCMAVRSAEESANQANIKTILNRSDSALHLLQEQ